MTRLLRELGRSHATVEVDAALEAVNVVVDGETAILTREAGRGEPLFGTRHARVVETVRIDPGVYGQTPTADARARLLSAAASLADRVHVHAPIVVEGTHPGRLAIDLPRRIVRALGLSTAEPGDRFELRFRHAFFDDEAIVREAERASLRYVSRRGGWVLLTTGNPRSGERAEPFAREVLRTLRTIRTAERLRQEHTPERAVTTMRDRGRRTSRRGAIGRARLRRAVFWVDVAFPGGPNCFRRTLVELALDAGAATETLVFGLDVGRTGHVAFKGAEERVFDVAFELAPPVGSASNRPGSDENVVDATGSLRR